ncbi:MAG: ribonuclease [Azovibrio sp.]|nr:ribonuclease [Azovibrio sp.]
MRFWLRLLLLALLLIGASAHAFFGAATRSIRADQLPPEGQQVLAQIKQGGPFAYPHKDGSVFHNFERRLPQQPRGYYREYTVPTPGAKNRGARRIVTGGHPPVEFYYTDDHYKSFRQILE